MRRPPSPPRTAHYPVQQRIGRLHVWLMCLIPCLAFAYPALIQPLILLKPASAYADMNFAANLDNSEGNNLNQVFWILLLCVGLYILRARFTHLVRALSSPPGRAVAAFFFVAMCSVTWSSVPDIAVRRLVLELVVVLCSFGAAAMVPDRRLLLQMLVAISLAAAIANCGMVVIQPAGRLGGWIGIYAHKNLLGVAAGLFLLFGLYQLAAARSWPGRIVGLALTGAAVALLIASRARTSQGLAVAVPAMAWVTIAISRRLRAPVPIILLAMASAVLILLLDMAVVGGLSFADLSNLLFGDATFSDRTDIWNFVLYLFRQRPVTGYGYGSFWGAGNDSAAYQQSSGFLRGLLQAHNGYLDILIETGWVGIATLAMLLIAVPRVLVATRRNGAEGWLFVSIFLFETLHNLLESSWYRGFSVQWVAFLILTGLAVASWLEAERPR